MVKLCADCKHFKPHHANGYCVYKPNRQYQPAAWSEENGDGNFKVIFYPMPIDNHTIAEKCFLFDLTDDAKKRNERKSIVALRDSGINESLF